MQLNWWRYDGIGSRKSI